MIALAILLVILVALEGAAIIPLHGISIYAAERNPRISPLRDLLGAMRIDATDPHGTGFLLVGASQLVALLAGALGFLALLLGGVNTAPLAAPALLAGVGVFIGHACETWLQPGPVQTERLRMRVTCRSCRRTVTMLRSEAPSKACRHCRAPLKPAAQAVKWPAWLLAGVFAAFWIAVVRPTSRSNSGPFALALFSGALWLLAWGLPKLINRARELSEGRLVNFEVMADVRTAFATLASCSLAVFCLNIYIRSEVRPDGLRTLADLTRLSARLASLSDGLARLKVTLCVTAVALSLATILLVAGRDAAFDRVLAMRKRAAKALKHLVFALKVVTAFTLASAATAGTTVDQLASTSLAIRGEPWRSTAGATAAVADALVSQAVDRELARDPKVAGCGAPGLAECPEELGGELLIETDRAERLRREWSERVPQPFTRPPAVADSLDAGALRTDIDFSFSEGRDTRLRLAIVDQTLAAATVPELARVTEAADLASAEAPTPPGSERLRSLIGVAFGLILDALPDGHKLELTLKPKFGPISQSLANNVTGAARSSFQDAVRDATFAAAQACSSAKGCRERVRQVLARYADDPRSERFGSAIAAMSISGVRTWVDTARSLRAANDRNEAALNALAAGPLRSEREGPLARLRDMPSSSDDEGRMRSDWRETRLEIAVGREPRGGFNPEFWNREFVRFLLQDPARAGAFVAMVRRDQAVMRYLGQHQPDGPNWITNGDILRSLVGKAPGAVDGPPGKIDDVLSSKAFSATADRSTTSRSRSGHAAPPSGSDVVVDPPRRIDVRPVFHGY